MVHNKAILTINVGSSSLKFAVFSYNEGVVELAHGSFKQIGENKTEFTVKQTEQKSTEQLPHLSPPQALAHLVQWLKQHIAYEIVAIGHRLVHGGPDLFAPVIINKDILQHLTNYIAFAPEHLPNALAGIKSIEQLYPNVMQVACFDTAFHQHLPVVAQTLPLPHNVLQGGLRKYGFHGLSYEFIYDKFKSIDKDADRKKIIIAHLGNGASMAAIQNGKSHDTTMGFTPAGGLIMGSRTGDMDPGIIVYLLQHYNLTPAELTELINHKAGLKGISGISSDMKTLCELKDNEYARLAIDMFVYSAKKHLGGLIAALGGIDTLIFTGGIGESNAYIREAICTGMLYTGIEIDTEKKSEHSSTISVSGAKVLVQVIKTDEERVIANHTIKFLK